MKILSKAFKMGGNFTGAPSFSEVNPYGFFRKQGADNYASVYPNVRAIANEFMQIKPYAIDKNGKPLQKNNIINALYHPNRQDSSVSFFEKIAVSALVHRKTYILVWRDEGGEAKPGGGYGHKGSKIAGFTFLENPAISKSDGKTYYTIGSQRFSEDSVIVLTGGVDPHDLYRGYSPTVAAKKWATLDDYMADFQRGFFENNAIPAGQFVITSATPKDFEDTVKEMENKHRGAGKNNNVTYVPRPIDPTTSKPMSAKIEWIPFAQSNKDIDFAPLFDQVDSKLDPTYGVPGIVKGNDDSATYANAQVSEKTFAKRAVYPLALRIWTQFTHELNRITGGMGIAITFAYEIPTVADEELVVASTKVNEANLINTMVMQGYTLDSIIDAFQLSTAYKLLKRGVSQTKIENDKPDVDEGDEVDGAPDPDKIDGVTPLNTARAEATSEDKLERVALNLMKGQIDEAIQSLTVQNIASDNLLDKFLADAIKIILPEMIKKGEEQHQHGVNLLVGLGLDTDTVQDFQLTDEQIDRYKGYLRSVGGSYSEDTTQSIRSILEVADVERWSRAQIEKALNQIPELEGYRARRLAVSEISRSGGNGSLYSMEQIKNETGYSIVKVWNVSGDACDFCQEMRGKKVAVEQPFIPLGGSVEAGDKTLLNNFVDVETADLHPFDHCYLTYEVQD